MATYILIPGAAGTRGTGTWWRPRCGTEATT